MKHIIRRILLYTLLPVFMVTVTACQKVEKNMMVSTGDFSKILANSAEVAGAIVDLGEGATQHGHCYGTSPNLRIDGSNLKTQLGKPSGTGGFTSKLTNLTAGTDYYFKAYLSDGTTTVYGKELTFRTTAASLPVITTSEVTSVTSTSALCGGNISSDGGSQVSARGVCWNTAAGPTISNSTTNNGTGTGSYSSNISGLNPGTTYYVRAYATTGSGTAYGEEKNFITVGAPMVTTTEITSVDSTSAISGGNVTSAGSGSVTSRGVCWSLSSNPTITDIKTDEGPGTGVFTSNITGLNPGSTYHVRAYATSSVGTGYGADLNFITDAVLPTVTTNVVTGITPTSASSGGNVTDDGGATVTLKGVCWSTNTGPTIADATSENGSGSGIFTSNLTGLTGGTKYYVRAYATNSAGTGYGNEVSFTAVDPVNAVFSYISNLDGWTADIDFTYISTAGNISTYIITSRLLKQDELFKIRKDHGWTESWGFVDLTLTGETANFYNSSNNFTVQSERTYELSLTLNWISKAVTLNMSNLTPSISTTIASPLSASTATSGGTILNQGSSTVAGKGVCWSTSPFPTTADDITSDGTGTGSYTSSLAGLTPATLYYVRAYATNSAGTSYGKQVSFETDPATVTDADGILYNVIRIGKQLWMKESLKTTKYNTGDLIGTTSPYNKDITSEYLPKYQWSYNGNESNVPVYGRLYTWAAATDSRNICPVGWHVSSMDEIDSLRSYLILNGYNYDGTTTVEKVAKSMGATTLWATSTIEGTIGNSDYPSKRNSSGFTAYPGGYRWIDGVYTQFGSYFHMWSSTSLTSSNAVVRYLRNSDIRLLTSSYNKNAGLSVRCIKD